MPFRRYSSPSRVAVVESRCEFEPASGSVMAKAKMEAPAARPGSHCLLLVVAEPGDHRAGDGGGDDHQQQGAAGGGQLLLDDGQLGHALPAAAVLLGQVDAQEPELAARLPELGGPAPDRARST